MKTKVGIIGAGPTGLFCALTLAKANKDYEITIFEKGNAIENRKCTAMLKNLPCQKCRTCAITEGEGGCGSFSDGKFPITNDFGGNLWEYIGREKSLELQYKVDGINKDLYFSALGEGAPAFPAMHSSKGTAYKKICIQHNLQLLNADIRHLGTDLGQIVYKELIKSLKELGVKILTNTTVSEIKRENDGTFIIKTPDIISPQDIVLVAAGRSGSTWVKDICKSFDIPTISNKIDLGIRFECPDEIWNHVTKILYESKIVYRTKTYEDLVRTFCMNPSGAVVSENTERGVTVNGHSFEDPQLKTCNTNFALLVSKTFTEPFNDSTEYGEAIIRLSNMLGRGVIIQRYGDLIRGKRSTKARIAENSVRPTLNAEPGDLSLVLPKRILEDILEMIQVLDHLAPGMTNDDNLLYGVECKHYNNVVKVDNNFETIENLYFGGDGAGITHSLSQASANGIAIAENILRKNL